MKPVYIEARDLPDAWFQCIYRIFEDDGVHEYVIDRVHLKVINAENSISLWSILNIRAHDL